MSVNKVILVGNVGKDPEIKYLEGGVAIASFPFATSEVYTKDDEKIVRTEWHQIVLWRKLAEIAEKHITKGKQLYIEGKIRSRSYQDKEGVKKWSTEIYGEQIQFLGKKESYKDNTDNSSLPGEEIKGEDLPF